MARTPAATILAAMAGLRPRQRSCLRHAGRETCTATLSENGHRRHCSHHRQDVAMHSRTKAHPTTGACSKACACGLLQEPGARQCGAVTASEDKEREETQRKSIRLRKSLAGNAGSRDGQLQASC